MIAAGSVETAVDVDVWLATGAPADSAEAADRALACRPEASTTRLRYAHDMHGRPVVRGSNELRVSVSHGGGLIAIAIAAGSRVGVDLERLEDRGFRRLSDHVLTTRERSELSHHGAARQVELLLGYWTRKEALLKAAGFGLAVDPRRVELPPPGSGEHPVAVPSELGRPEEWWVVQLDVPGFAGAVAVDGPPHVTVRRARAAAGVVSATPGV